MGKVGRRRYGADFKAKVTLSELAAKHGIHQTIIVARKWLAIEGVASTFSGKLEGLQASSEADSARLHAVIRQFVAERDLLAKASGR